MTTARLTISYTNHGGSEGHCRHFNQRVGNAAIAEHIADGTDIWPMLREHGIDGVWIYIDLNSTLTNDKPAKTDASWNRKWRVDETHRVFECWNVVLDGTPLAKTFRKDYAAGAAWLGAELERLGRLALVQVAAHYGAEHTQLEAIAKGQCELSEILKQVPRTLSETAKRFSVTVEISHPPTMHPNDVLTWRSSLSESLHARIRKQRLGVDDGGESSDNFFSFCYLTSKPERLQVVIREHLAAAQIDVEQVLIHVENA